MANVQTVLGPVPARLRAAGVSDAEIETMTVANPRRILSIG
jgi:predicted metal-dependent phosphotriesterase family hydrolase